MAESNIPEDPEEGRTRLLSRIRSNSSYISFVSTAVGALALLGGSVIYVFIEELRTFALSVVIIGAVLLVLSTALSFRRVTGALTGRRGRYGVNTLVMTSAFLAIAVLVNYLAFINDTRFDVTATGEFSLAQRTVRLLKDLDEPVRATAFFDPLDPNQVPVMELSEDLLTEFERRSSKFTFRFMDPALERNEAIRLGVGGSPSIVFEAMESGRRLSLLGPFEQDFTTALLIVTGVEQKKVYYLTGHKEPIPEDFDTDTGFGLAASGILGDNYSLEPLNLLGPDQQDWSQDAAVLVVVRPQQDLLTQERDSIYNYLRNGGRALFLLESDTPPGFAELLSRWGLALGDGAIEPRQPCLLSYSSRPSLSAFKASI